LGPLVLAAAIPLLVLTSLGVGVAVASVSMFREAA